MTADEGILRQVLALAPLPALRPPADDALDGRTVLLLNCDVHLHAALSRAVNRCGGRAVGWDDEHGRPAAGSGAVIDAIIDGGMRGIATADIAPGVWREPMRRTVGALRYVYDDWSREPSARRLHYIAVTTMGGAMGLDAGTGADRFQPLGGLWAGLAKTLPREFPGCDVRVVDLGPGGDPGAVVLAEMLGARLLEVGVAHGRRRTILPRVSHVDGEPIRFSPPDVLLFTGGGRGIGFEIALDMACRTGCRVIVSGRTSLPGDRGDELKWFTATEEEFAQYERQAYAQRGAGAVLHDVRRELRAMRQARETRANLLRARRAGADVLYRSCDVADSDQVAALVGEAGEHLACVVHNAGIDAPARLPKKDTEAFLDLIAVKVDGFLQVVRAVGSRKLKMLCAVGSLTGRYGGMVGQLDYAAANECLARLALWAGTTAGCRYPVKSLSWPTWDGLGLITNLDAAARYMRPISVESGVRAWREELTRDGRGEIGFVGEIGDLAPQQVHGIVVPSDWSGRSRMLTRRFFLGDVFTFVPMSTLETRHPVDEAWATCAQDVDVCGAPAVPISLVLEYLLTASTWLVPPHGEPPRVRALREVRVCAPALRLDAGRIEFTRRARIDWRGGEGEVRVGLWRRDRSGEVPAAEAVVVLGPTDAGASEGVPAAPAAVAAGGSATALTDQPPQWHGVPYRWKSLILDATPWLRSADGWTATVSPAEPADLFAFVDPPRPQLPLAHLEACIGVSRGGSPGGSPATGPLGSANTANTWLVRSADLTNLDRSAAAAAAVKVSADGRYAEVVDISGVPLVRLEEPRWAAFSWRRP